MINGGKKEEYDLMKWMNENTMDEIKKKRKILHAIALMNMLTIFVVFGGFLFMWCFTTDSIIPLPMAIVTITLTITYATYIVKRDLCSVLLFLKEATEPETKQ
jgi:flagellar basal body-associated protein FliL